MNSFRLILSKFSLYPDSSVIAKVIYVSEYSSNLSLWDYVNGAKFLLKKVDIKQIESGEYDFYLTCLISSCILTFCLVWSSSLEYSYNLSWFSVSNSNFSM